MSAFVCPYCSGKAVLEAICGLGWLGRRYVEGYEWLERMTVRRVAGATTALLKAGGREDLGEGVTPRKVGEVVRQVLGLETARSSQVGGARVVIWDGDRIAELRERFGVDQERLDEVVRILGGQEGEAAAAEG